MYKNYTFLPLYTVLSSVVLISTTEAGIEGYANSIEAETTSTASPGPSSSRTQEFSVDQQTEKTLETLQNEHVKALTELDYTRGDAVETANALQTSLKMIKDTRTLIESWKKEDETHKELQKKQMETEQALKNDFLKTVPSVQQTLETSLGEVTKELQGSIEKSKELQDKIEAYYLALIMNKNLNQEKEPNSMLEEQVSQVTLGPISSSSLQSEEGLSLGMDKGTILPTFSTLNLAPQKKARTVIKEENMPLRRTVLKTYEHNIKNVQTPQVKEFGKFAKKLGLVNKKIEGETWQTVKTDYYQKITYSDGTTEEKLVTTTTGEEKIGDFKRDA